MPRIFAPFFKVDLVAEKYLILLISISGLGLQPVLSRTQKCLQLPGA